MLSDCAFFDYCFAGGVFLCVEGVGDLGAFVEGEVGEEGDFFQEGLVHSTALECAVH